MRQRRAVLLALAVALALPHAAVAVTKAEAGALTETLERILYRVLVDRTMIEACRKRADKADMIAELNGLESDVSWQLVLLEDPAALERTALQALEADYSGVEAKVAAATQEYLRPC